MDGEIERVEGGSERKREGATERGRGIDVPDGGSGGQLPPPPNSCSLSTLIRAESRDYSGKTQYMFD